ncbi:hypothetical protein OEZ85_013122 [Tetradesmus obliquus]|uniref:ATP-dependent DNA helicase n=1 Tax=Tetradesmus obliquus TaxID=3088 RepID=A0ABY8U4Z8_TETOB|nr:hypothetical protein OEZ85_013122 [Tetradesmus obliquus]
MAPGEASHAQQMHQMLGVLQQYWGYNTFRPPQDQVILNALVGNDSLVVMATGGGKSICYQVPPLVTGLPCVVVSPLIALMEDQVAALTARGVSAAFLGSAQSSAEVKRKAWAGEYQLLYITPELATGNTAALQQLHATRRIGLIAIDEAHCVSEWGHDFRPSYRQLGVLRQALPGVPIMAVTATATQRVQQDILNQLGMGRPGQPQLRQWVMSFQRTNLQLSVSLKNGTAAANNLAGLVADAKAAEARGVRLEATLVYAQTTKEVDELAAYLQQQGVSAVKYHAKLPVRERNQAHRAFQCDDACVMVASLAFGMGIDKPNIRRIIHYGITSSLEAYYQQAGRAGRDGLPAHCSLLWTPQDFMTQDFIKGAGSLSGWSSDSHKRGMDSLRAYTSSGGCRHAALVNYFQPGTLPQEGPCTGGCDNCKRRADAAAAAAASGTQLAPGMSAGETDVTEAAKLLVATVKAMKHYGLNKSVAVLRGSKAKGVEQWMREAAAADGSALYGAGSSRSEDWWKGLGAVLLGEGFLASQSKTNNHSGASFSIVTVTAKGAQLLAGRPARLCLLLPAHLEAEDARQRQREQREAAEQQRREAVQQAKHEEAAEREVLLAELKRARKATADALGQAPDVLVNDLTLNSLLELRPATQQQLELVSGFGQAALQHFAAPLLQAGESAEQVATAREKPIQVSTVLGYLAEAAAGAGASPGGCSSLLLQRLQQEAELSGSAGCEVALWRIAGALHCQAAAGLSGLKRARPDDSYGQIKAAAGLPGLKRALPDDSYGQIKVVAAMQCFKLLPGPADFEEQQMVQQPTQQVQRSAALSKLLPVPSSSSQRLYAMWSVGVPLAALGSMGGLNMQLQAVLGALADMAAAGYPTDLQQLAAAAQLTEAAARSIAAAISSQGEAGIGAVKQALDPHQLVMQHLQYVLALGQQQTQQTQQAS